MKLHRNRRPGQQMPCARSRQAARASSAGRGRWWLPTVIVVVALAAMVLWRASHGADPVEVVLPFERERMTPELSELVETYVNAARAAPTDARRHAELAMVYEANLMWSEAGRSYANALALDPEQPTWAHHAALVEYYRTSDLAAATAAMRAVAERFPSYAPAAYQLGDFLLEAGDFALARPALESALRLAPRTPDAHVALGDLALREGDLDSAQDYLQRATELDPSYSAAHYLLGRVYQKRGLADRAALELMLGQDTSKRVTADPLGEHLVDYAARIDDQLVQVSQLLRDRRFERAEELARKVLARRPEHAAALTSLGVALLEQNQLAEAVSTLQRSIAIEPDQVDARVNLAACYLELRKPGDALREADAALERQPTFAHAHFLRSQSLFFAGEQVPALDPMLRAVELAPKDVSLLGSLAALQKSLMLYDEARNSTLQLTELMPGDWRPWADLVQLSVMLGDADGAGEALRKVREHGGADEVVSSLTTQVEGLRAR